MTMIILVSIPMIGKFIGGGKWLEKCWWRGVVWCCWCGSIRDGIWEMDRVGVSLFLTDSDYFRGKMVVTWLAFFGRLLWTLMEVLIDNEMSKCRPAPSVSLLQQYRWWVRGWGLEQLGSGILGWLSQLINKRKLFLAIFVVYIF